MIFLHRWLIYNGVLPFRQPPTQNLRHLEFAEWFCQMIVHTGFDTFHPISGQGVGCQCDNRQLAAAPGDATHGPDSAGGIISIHDRHLAIHENYIVRFILNSSHRHFTIFGQVNPAAKVLQNSGRNFLINGIILHHQHQRCFFRKEFYFRTPVVHSRVLHYGIGFT